MEFEEVRKKRSIEGDKLVETKGEVVYSTGKGGAIFSKFTLLLPRESKVSRDASGRLEIDTKRFTVTIEIDFEGYSTSLPISFIERYVGLKPYHAEGHTFEELVKTMQINIIVSVEFKFGALLTATGWEYYKWIDSFLDTLDSNISTARFLSDIGWNTTASMLRCFDNDKKQENK